ncbi:helix-turn-helix transcriptional regulator [Ligilactobacillus salivarius]|uniref:helix-turn-helix transcriptional regulator n=1 Tax=Ligilactobacillus salivarius TaxID=1624 RepID=UPI00136AA2E7|nr:helix-turn-helix domain-containing protein [Ligilactobacillus salivarius]MDD1403590.1 helix-turn-helix domain-containing protein [Ligilactobacillus salivarius]MYV09166.1 helix-turn-helix domain-containing protein [Ligilactobacillus salivarius]MYY78912.1 helix-turn-helix domain-containing protein [Ligilactobacillus salivarius]
MIVTATYEHKLSDADIERIAERVVRKLERNSNKQKLLNITEAAKHCGVSPTTFYRWRKRNKNLQAIELTAGGVVQFRAEDLDKFLESK